MKYRKLAGTKIKLPEIGLDLSEIVSRAPEIDSRKARHLLQYAVDRGISLFSTSDFESEGLGQTWIGEALSKDRERIAIASKINCEGGVTPKSIRSGCEASLRRLLTDHIDIFQLHHPDIQEIRQDDIYETLKKLHKEGKILTWGASLKTDKEELEDGELMLRFRKAPLLEFTFHPLAIEPGDDLLEASKKRNANVFLRDPFAQGAFESLAIQPEAFREFEFLVSPGRTLQQGLLLWALSYAAVTSVLVPIQSDAEIHDFSGLQNCPPLHQEEIQAAAAVFKKLSGRLPAHPLWSV